MTKSWLKAGSWAFRIKVMGSWSAEEEAEILCW